MKIVFLGSGPFAVPTLERLHARREEYPLVRVISRPDRAAGRGRKLRPTAVRARARELGLRCDVPESTADPDYIAELRELGASLFIVADYGEILRSALCAVPSVGTFNLHASLLPKFRGASPVQYAILEGETRTGVTLFRVEPALDSGPIVARAEVEVRPQESAGELEERLSLAAADLLERNLASFAEGTFSETPQRHELATRAPKIRKEDALIDWTAGAERVSAAVRAYDPWPGAFSFLYRAGKPPERTVFTKVRPTEDDPSPVRERQGGIALGRAGGRPGSIEIVTKKRFRVVCGRGSVEVERLQPSGKAEMDTAAYMQGRRLEEGDRFGAP